MSYLVIGDVHGCLAELRDLLRLAGEPGRRIVFVGDLVGKGPQSAGVVALARELDALAVRGNHDEHALNSAYAPDVPTVLAPRSASEHDEGWVAMCQSLGAEDWRWLGERPYFLRLPEVGAVVVHAGLVPGVRVEDQDPAHLVTMRTLQPDGTPSKRLRDGVLWAERWPGPELVVFGHDAVSGLQTHPFAFGLDTGCVYGGRLTGLRLPEHTLHSVPARDVWIRPGE